MAASWRKSPPPKAREGSPCSCLRRGRSWSTAATQPPLARRYGEAVAAIHNALEDFASPHPRFVLDLRHLIDEPLERAEPHASRWPEDWDYLCRFATAVRQALVALPEASLERGVCHGDLQCYHAHVDEAGRLTFFDFDCGGQGFRAYDLAVFRWCARLQGQEETRWPAFLSAYRAARAVSELDVSAVPLFVCARHIWHIGVHAQNVSHWGCGDLNAGYYGPRVAALRALANDYRIGV